MIEVTMYEVYVTVDPKTGRGLYHDERIFKGYFTSFQEAYDVLGDVLIKFCSVRAVNERRQKVMRGGRERRSAKIPPAVR